MYFLSKFCRICIKSSADLKDIDTVDYDSIKFSEKLKVCTKMVINKGGLSSLICTSCINKLRISYDFDNMCKKSTIILQGYLSELIGTNESTNTFTNTDLFVQLSKLPQQRKHRHYVTKEQRCSLLKELLTKIKDDKKHFKKQNHFKTKHENVPKNNLRKHGSLKTLINFTKFYNYGYKLEEKKIADVKFDSSSLDKLTEFVHTFFNLGFIKYHDNISYVLEQAEDWADDSDVEDMFNNRSHENFSTNFKFEEVIVEPDINIKKEIFVDETDIETNSFEESYQSTSNLGIGNVKQEDVHIKIEPEEHMLSDNSIGYLKQNRFLAEIIPIRAQQTSNKITETRPALNKNAELYPVLCQSLDRRSQSTLDLLQEYTEQKFRRHRKPFSHNNAKCRTKDHPYISPQLKRQFLHQDFKCSVCNRRFKSQGYLQAHYSKMKHKPR